MKLLPIIMLIASIASSLHAENRVVNLEGVDCKLFLPDPGKATGRAVVICPGGAYTHHAVEHEGTQWAPFFNERGIAVAVLVYSLPKGDRNIPLADAEKTFSLLRANAAEWNINPEDIGIMGFSAGGHFAATVATGGAPGAKPAFQILFYPVISMDPAITHSTTHNEFLGKDASPELEKEFSNENRVTESTPRAILFFSSNDGAVPVENGFRYARAMAHASKSPVSFILYPEGGHGWGFNTSFKHHDEMLKTLSAWLATF